MAINIQTTGIGMKSLLKEFGAQEGQTAYQTYIMQHGIEKISILVPLKKASIFEAEFLASEDKSKSVLLGIIARHSGKIKG